MQKGKHTKEISILLGAGFSVPAGYPAGDELNSKILRCDSDKKLIIRNNRDAKAFDLCKKMMCYYADKGKSFDYEKFYDYYKCDAKNDENLKQYLYPTLDTTIVDNKLKPYWIDIDRIYNKIIAYYLKDKYGNTYYDKVSLGMSAFKEYSVFFNYIEKLLKCGYTINVHTLNHDLLFEHLCSKCMSDGFNIDSSPYVLEHHGGKEEKLPYYQDIYNTKLRLYKLHGSLNYYVYHGTIDNWVLNKEQVNPNNYVKINMADISDTILCKKLDADGNEEDLDWFNYHPDFLTGVMSKIHRYNNPFYKNLITHFHHNLKHARSLIIIGYGGKDRKINEIINRLVKYKKAPILVMNPSEDIKNFVCRCGKSAKHIKKSIAEFSFKDCYPTNKLIRHREKQHINVHRKRLKHDGGGLREQQIAWRKASERRVRNACHCRQQGMARVGHGQSE